MRRREWVFHAGDGESAYRCGLRPGTRLRLLRELCVTQEGRVLRSHAEGSEWSVIGNRGGGVLWLMAPDGEAMTWDDDGRVFDDFAVLDEERPRP